MLTTLRFQIQQNNFAAETGKTEALTKERQAEEIRFLHAVMETPAMKFAHKYLVVKGLSPADPAAFKKQLWDIWFQPYNRGEGYRSSSGFEHVFIGCGLLLRKTTLFK